jgi:transglutaminase-like putative cysteine protease
MHYQITHTTNYGYSTPVNVCHNILTLTPRADDRVRCQNHRLRIRPHPTSSHRRIDYFGNHVMVFSIEENHDELSITSNSRVHVKPQPTTTPSSSVEWSTVSQRVSSREDSRWLSTYPYLFDSPRVQRNDELKAFALLEFLPQRPILESLLGLNSRIHREFEYDPVATHVFTPTLQAFRLKRGVCQDFAHILVASLRTIGLPARYVSGYLRTIPRPGKERLVGADQSHAWVAAYCGEQLGWVEVDPTNDCICGTDHIPIAWGRDYSDIVPVRGVFLGGGENTINVSVDVMPMEIQSA